MTRITLLFPVRNSLPAKVEVGGYIVGVSLGAQLAHQLGGGEPHHDVEAGLKSQHLLQHSRDHSVLF